MAPTASFSDAAPSSGSGSFFLTDGHLSPEQVARFHRDGYLCLPNFFDPAPILSHAQSLVKNFSLEGHPLTKFTTDREEDGGHVGDDYFLSSGDQVRYFFEERAIKDGKLNREKDKAVNKVGHGLHIRDSVFHGFSFDPALQNLSRSLDFAEPNILQSMIICKQPQIGGAVPHHNDSTFLYTDPPSAVGLWFALEDCGPTNGSLSFMPGSHRWPKGEVSKASAPRPLEDPAKAEQYGPLRGINSRFVRKDPYPNPTSGTTFKTLGAGDEEVEWDEDKARPEYCEKGTLVLIHGSVLHQSRQNLSNKSRYIYTFHMIEGAESRAKYDSSNWLQPTVPGEKFSQLLNPPPAPLG